MIIKFENLSHSILPEDYCEIDYIENIVAILKSACDDSYELYVIHSDYKDQIPVNEKKKIAIHIGNEFKFDKRLYKKFDFVFRFYHSEKCDYKKVYPINIGYNCSGAKHIGINFKFQKPLIERKTDVFFIGHGTKRKSFIKAVKGLKGQNYKIEITDGFRQGLKMDDYLTALSEAKICLVPNGMSPETFRYTEAFASGCIVITTERVNTWYYEKSPAIFLNSWKDLTDELINKILSGDLNKLYSDNLEYYRNYLSAEANATYILSIIRNAPFQPAKKLKAWFNWTR